MMCLVLGLGIGIAGTEVLEYVSGAGPMKDVLIIAQHEDGSYTMRADDGRVFETFFCHGRDDLSPGNKLKVFAFEQQVGCKNIRGEKLGYSVYVHQDGSRAIFPIPKETAYVR